MANEKNPVVYSLADPRTGEVRYVGQTVDGFTRIRKHWTPSVLQRDPNKHKSNWIRQLLAVDCIPIVSILERATDPSVLDDLEAKWIEYYRASGSPLLNIRQGGRTSRGYKHSEATKEKISKKNKGRIVPRDQVERARATRNASSRYATAMAQLGAQRRGKPRSPEACRGLGWTGRRHTPETKEKIAAKHRGKRASAEVRQKMSRSRAGKAMATDHYKKLSVLFTGRKVTGVWRARLSSSHQTSQKAKAHRARLADAKRGVPMSKEARRYLSSVTGGRPFQDQTGRVFYSQGSAAQELGLRQSDVNNMLRGRQKSVKGYVFTYCADRK